MKTYKLSVWTIGLLCILFSCAIKNAKAPHHRIVTVYTDQLGAYDSLLIQKFEKEEKISVHLVKLKTMEILARLEQKKYNCEADLIVLSDYEALLKAARKGLLHQVDSERLREQIDPIYRSKKNYWFALSKTPFVMACRADIPENETIKNYHELLWEKWKGQLVLQDPDDRSRKEFEYAVRLKVGSLADSFLLQLSYQAISPGSGGDLDQLKSIANGKGSYALVRLSAIIGYQADKKNKVPAQKIKILFPNQRRRGCFVSITGAGVSRYAANSEYALRLLTFLSGPRAQYKYAAGRNHFPIMERIAVDYKLAGYRKIRMRFYRKRFK